MKSYLKRLFLLVLINLFVINMQAIYPVAFIQAFGQFEQLVQEDNISQAQNWLNKFWNRLSDEQKRQVIKISQSHEQLLVSIQGLQQQNLEKSHEHDNQENNGLQELDSLDEVEEQTNQESGENINLETTDLQDSSNVLNVQNGNEEEHNESRVDQQTIISNVIQRIITTHKNMNLLAARWDNDLSDQDKDTILQCFAQQNENTDWVFNQLQNIAANNQNEHQQKAGLFIQALQNFWYQRFITQLQDAQNGQEIIDLWRNKMQLLHTGNHDNDIAHIIRTHDNGHLLMLLQQTEGQAAQQLVQHIQPIQSNNHVEQENTRPNITRIQLQQALLHQLNENQQANNQSNVQNDQVQLDNQNNNNSQINQNETHNVPIVEQNNATSNNIFQWHIPTWAPAVLCVGTVVFVGWLWDRYKNKDKKAADSNKRKINRHRRTRIRHR